jgi:hypothetical protein
MAARTQNVANANAAESTPGARPTDDVATAGWEALSDRLAAGRYRMSNDA